MLVSWSAVAQTAPWFVPLLLPLMSRVSRHLLARLTFAAAAKHPDRRVTLKVQRRLGASYEITVGGPERDPEPVVPDEASAPELPPADDQKVGQNDDEPKA